MLSGFTPWAQGLRSLVANNLGKSPIWIKTYGKDSFVDLSRSISLSQEREGEEGRWRGLLLPFSLSLLLMVGCGEEKDPPLSCSHPLGSTPARTVTIATVDM